MQAKNYYQILGIAPDATNNEIKTAYRKLALMYHPDKNASDKVAENVFKEVNEAYSVLSDRSKRAAYHRDYPEIITSSGKGNIHFADAEMIYRQLMDIRSAIAQSDPYRMNTEALFFEMQQLFSAFNIAVLIRENNIPCNNRIIAEALTIIVFLPFKQQKTVLTDTGRITHHAQKAIVRFQKRQSRVWFWERYKTLFVLLVTVILCCLLYFITR